MEALILAIQVACALALLAGFGLSLWITWVARDLEAPRQRPLAEVTPIAPRPASPAPRPAEDARRAA